MTKYILHGGATTNKTNDNKKFFSEIIEDIKKPINILCVYFARDKEEWEKLFNEEKLNFSNVVKNKNLIFTLASDNLKRFIEQIKGSDVIFLRGGRNQLIFEMLGKIDDLKNLFQNKTIAGSSAGAYALSKYYYRNSADEIREGTGVLPIKTIAHYSEEKLDSSQKLKKHKEDLPVYKIPEEKFFVIEQ